MTAPSMRQHAAHMLQTELAIAGLSLQEATVVVDYMKPKRGSTGMVLMQEGERETNGFMLLILQGEVRIESRLGGDTDPMVLGVLGEGSVLGEMALLDDEPRSATCIALSDLRMAVLTRQALQQLIDEHPSVGARLMTAIAKRLADRLRQTLRKFKTHVRVNQAMRKELDVMMMAEISRAPATTLPSLP